ncbi:hypothetical protein BD413DRAFT_540472 [Trametes elegans]|nr:hypothetical protein BD413DRAFT_540472 [Trametes elegans]
MVGGCTIVIMCCRCSPQFSCTTRHTFCKSLCAWWNGNALASPAFSPHRHHFPRPRQVELY